MGDFRAEKQRFFQKKKQKYQTKAVCFVTKKIELYLKVSGNMKEIGLKKALKPPPVIYLIDIHP